jgi:hypothetical protein
VNGDEEVKEGAQPATTRRVLVVLTRPAKTMPAPFSSLLSTELSTLTGEPPGKSLCLRVICVEIPCFGTARTTSHKSSKPDNLSTKRFRAAHI